MVRGSSRRNWPRPIDYGLMAAVVALVAGIGVAAAATPDDEPATGLAIDSTPPETLPGPEWSWRVEQEPTPAAAETPATTGQPTPGQPAATDPSDPATSTPGQQQQPAAPSVAADEPTPTTPPVEPQAEPEATWSPHPGPTLPGPDYGPGCADWRDMPCNPDPCHQGTAVQVQQHWQTWPNDGDPRRWVCV